MKTAVDSRTSGENEMTSGIETSKKQGRLERVTQTKVSKMQRQHAQCEPAARLIKEVTLAKEKGDGNPACGLRALHLTIERLLQREVR